MGSKGPRQHSAADATTLAARPGAARRRAQDRDPAAESEPPSAPSWDRSRSVSAPPVASEHAIARALRDDEQMRARSFSGLATLMSLALLGTLPMLGGDRAARLVS